MNRRRKSFGSTGLESLEERRVLTSVIWPVAEPLTTEELGQQIVANFHGRIDEVVEQRDFASQQEVIDALQGLATDYWEELLGQTVTPELGQQYHPWMFDRFDPTNLVAIQADFRSEAAGLSSFATNVRTVGIDEADHAEMLGDGLVLVRHGGQAQIFDVSQPDDIRWVSTIGVEQGRGSQFIYADGRLAVISSQNVFEPWGGFVVDFWPNEVKPSSTIALYDLGDPASPSLLSRAEFDGVVRSAHLVDGSLILGTSSNQAPPDLDVVSDGDGFRFETETEYLDRVSELLPQHFIGQVRRIDADGEVVSTSELGDFADFSALISSQSFGVELTRLLMFDFESDSLELVDSEVVAGVDFVFGYVDVDSVYAVEQGEASAIYEFAHNETDVGLVATGSVPGRILSSRSMDESGGVLRVVTSGSNRFGGDELSDLHVLQAVDGELETVGQLLNIADGQSQYGVIFDGDLAYVTTAEFSPGFIPIDPLHIIDLSDPAAPVELSELEIPGVVTSLRRVGQSHLVGVGFAVDSPGTPAKRQVTLFDISDLAAPTIVENWVGDAPLFVGQLWMDWSASEMDIRYTEDGLLTIDGGVAQTEVFRIDPTGSSPVQHIGNIGSSGWFGPSARSFVHGDILVLAADGQLTTYDLADLSEPLDRDAVGNPLSPVHESRFTDELEATFRPLDNARVGEAARITKLTSVEGDGTATIGEDGRSIVIRRTENTRANASVGYEVTLPDGRVLETSLSVRIRPARFDDTSAVEYADASASLSISASDGEGNPITSAAVGDEIWLTLTADWERSSDASVFAAYANVEFDTSLFAVLEIEPLGVFVNGTSGTEISDNGIANLGGFSEETTKSFGPGEIARFQVEVLGEGDMRFDVSASSGVAYQFLVFDESHPIDPARIDSDSLVLDLATDQTQGQIAEFRSTDIDQDGFTSPIDVLYLVNEINRRLETNGSGEQASLVTAGAAAAGSQPMLQRMDVTGDGHISAIDVLHVVNYINANNASQGGEGESQADDVLSESDIAALAASQAADWAEEVRNRR